ncbi:MAG: bifunctional methionine sulfoxide reductase B/A protein [Burkholderiales bacterium]|nr:bifunctional methionine sulfoxide reductase B/A protein [Burkholderiales bacterium]
MFKTSSLTPLQHAILINKSTEHPFSGEYTDNEQMGTYLCRNCGLALFRASSKFHSACGWPSFDGEIDGAVKSLPDADGRRTEIICSRCAGHLGHVFHGEQFTAKNTRHCVNSASLDFVTNTQVVDSEEIILAAGCFWGVEYYLQKLPGVLLTQVGYCGGHKLNPTYQEVCTKTTGHLEVVRVIFDPTRINLEQILKCFFEIHDPEQQDGQGPDIGNQYLSAIFYYNEEQKAVAETLIAELIKLGYQPATKLLAMAPFWIGEEYHRDYYDNKGTLPYCHGHTKRF